MSKKNSLWSRSLFVTSPVLVITALAVLLSVNTVLNYEEETPVSAEMPEPTDPSELVVAEAMSIWAEYNESLTNDELVITYTGEEMVVQGILDSWEITTENDIVLRLVTHSDRALVSCTLIEKFNVDDPIYDLDQINSYVFKKVAIVGTCNGWVDGEVVFTKCIDISLAVEDVDY